MACGPPVDVRNERARLSTIERVVVGVKGNAWRVHTKLTRNLFRIYVVWWCGIEVKRLFPVPVMGGRQHMHGVH